MLYTTFILLRAYLCRYNPQATTHTTMMRDRQNTNNVSDCSVQGTAEGALERQCVDVLTCVALR
jgi:hypothetical protein